MKKQFLLSKAILTLGLVLVTFSGVQAATSTATTSNKKVAGKIVATTTATSTTPDKIVTANGDELCILSNGDKIPCVYKDDAEKQIKTVDKIVTDSGNSICLYNNKYISCDYISNGKVNYKYYIHTASSTFFLFMYYNYLKIIIIIVVLVLTIFILNKRKRHENNK